MTLSETDFDCTDVGANTVTLTVTDDNSNVSTCTSTDHGRGQCGPHSDLPELDGSA